MWLLAWTHLAVALHPHARPVPARGLACPPPAIRACAEPLDELFQAARPLYDSAPPADEADADDPVYNDALWLRSEQVRYGDALNGGGVGHCAVFDVDGHRHTRAILVLDTSGGEAPCELAERLALCCETIALAPLLGGGGARWPHERLAQEAWAAITYLNEAHDAVRAVARPS